MSRAPEVRPDEPVRLERRTSGPRVRDAAEFHQAVSRLVRVWMLRERNRAGSHNLSTSGLYALDVLVRLGTIGVNELAAELFVDKSTASRIIAGLEEKGYVARQLDPDDRRSVRIEVSDLGRELHRRIQRDNIREAAQLLESADADTSDGLTRQLRAIARASAGEAL